MSVRRSITPPPRGGLEHVIARLLSIGTLASMSLVAVGVLAMVANGISPVDRAPELDPGRLLGDLAALRPAAFLWLGLIGIIATPCARVLAAGIGYLRSGERGMAAVGLLVLVVVALGVVTGTARI